MNLRLEHLCKSYGDVKAVRDVTLDVDGKHFVVLAGPSGCGKSTLLNMIAGFLKEDRGNIYFDDISINDVEPSKRGIAMVFQDSALFSHMSVYENIAMGLEYSGLSKAESHKRVTDMAKLVGIDDLLRRRANALSNGQKQRVSIARALVRSPKLFLMDEPLSALDARLKSQLRIDLAKLYKQMDATFLYVTHDQVEAMTLADLLIIMKDGSFQQVGSPMEIYHDPCNLFTASFLGKFDINCFHASIQDQHICFEDHRVPCLKQVKDQKVVMALRPEWIHLDSEYGFEGKIVLIENLGDEIYYHIAYKDQIVIMKGNMYYDLHIEDTIHFNFRFQDAFYFDTKSEKRLYIL